MFISSQIWLWEYFSGIFSIIQMSNQKSLLSRLRNLHSTTKLVLCFAIFTAIALITTNVFIHVRLEALDKETLGLITNENDQFNFVSTKQVSEALTKTALVARDIDSMTIYQIQKSYLYFSRHRNQLSNPNGNQQDNYSLTQNFATPKKTPAVYFYNENSTFHDDPFIDPILKTTNFSLLTNFRRISIFYWNESNPADMMAKTFPATADFIIRNYTTVLKRAGTLREGVLQRDAGYLDDYSKANKTSLNALRTVIYPSDRPGFKMMIEQETTAQAFLDLSKLVYYFPTTTVIHLTILPNGSYEVAESTKRIDFNLTPFVQPGLRNVQLQNGTVVFSGTVGKPRWTFLDSFANFSYGENTVFRFIIMIDKESSKEPFRMMSSFLNGNEASIVRVMYTFSFFVFLLVLAISVNVGRHIVGYLNFLTQQIRQYLVDPGRAVEVAKSLRALASKGSLTEFRSNIIDIIDKIQHSKVAMIELKNQHAEHYHNILYRPFQKYAGTQQYIVMDKIYDQLDKTNPNRTKSQTF